MAAQPRVVCALLEDSGRFLLARRKEGISNAGLWEFPGGKREGGESDEACLKRELNEEFGLEASVGAFFMESATGDGSLLLVAYHARSEGTIAFLKDHDALALERPGNFAEYEFSQADIPIARALGLRGDGRMPGFNS